MCDRWRWVTEDSSLGREMPTEDVKKFFDDLNLLGVQNLLITGGEPLLRRDLVEIMHHTRKLKLRTSIITAGLQLNENLISELISNNWSVTLSIDGYGDVHDKIRRRPGLFSQVDANMTELIAQRQKLKSYSKIGINIVAMDQNLSSILPLISHALKRGIDSILISPVHQR